MFLFPRRDTAALAALRDGYIELGTRVILMEALLEDTRKRIPYRTREVRKDQRDYRAAKSAIEAKLRLERGV